MPNVPRALRIFVWSYVFVYAVFTSLSITQVDLWWQLAEGQHILHTGTLPTQPVAAFGLPAAPYFDEYAGYEVVLALIYHVTGFVGIWAVFSAVYLAILLLPAATTGRKYPSFDLASILALASAILLIHPRLQQRPELVGVLFQVLLMILLRASSLEKITRRLIICLFLIFVAWSNTHSTFLFGLFTLGLWIANEAWRLWKTIPLMVLVRRGAMLVLLAVIASAVTPYGPRRLLFPFLEASDFGSTSLSPEMWPILTYPPVVLELTAIGLVLLVWGILTTRPMPLWLIAFSIFSLVISLKSFRFIDFAAISMLFVYAERREPDAAPAWQALWFLRIPGTFLLGGLCIFFLFFDVFDLLGTYSDMRVELRFATHGLRYASDMAAYPMEAESRRIPVLSGHGMGSYLSFKENGNFQPLLDSGLSHFSDDTKRYFFLLWSEPEALDLVLKELHVDYVLLDADTFNWILPIRLLPDWQFVTCSDHGMIWKRNPGGPHPLSEADRSLIAQSIDILLQRGFAESAFAYSTLIDPPAKSLALLADHRGRPWSEGFFNSLREWVNRLSPSDVAAFLASDSGAHRPLLGAIVAERAGPEAYDRFVASLSQPPTDWFGKEVAVDVLLRKGDVAGARRVFDSISPAPPSSTTYHRLWHAVHAQDSPVPDPGAYGRWQTWDASGPVFLEDMSVRLNNRIDELDRKP
jgi:hypothetical protein